MAKAFVIFPYFRNQVSLNFFAKMRQKKFLKPYTHLKLNPCTLLRELPHIVNNYEVETSLWQLRLGLKFLQYGTSIMISIRPKSALTLVELKRWKRAHDNLTPKPSTSRPKKPNMFYSMCLNWFLLPVVFFNQHGFWFLLVSNPLAKLAQSATKQALS